MVDFLYSFPEPLLLALSALLFGTLIVALPMLVQRLPVLHGNDLNTDFLLRMQAPLFTMTALVLAFTLVQAEANSRWVDSQVTTEASHINQLDRLLARYGTDQASQIRPILLGYARSVVRDEWRSMLKGEGSDKARQLYSRVSHDTLLIEPQAGRQSQIYGEMLKALDAIAQSRDARLDNADVHLPGIYWDVIGFAVLVLLVVTSTAMQTPYRRAVLAAQMSLLGAFIGLVFLMDRPFKGETAVSPAPIAQIIKFMEQRQK